ncbi:hypothetical protein GGI12_003455, partial [Dipsacomyces acuminosporus]
MNYWLSSLSLASLILWHAAFAQQIRPDAELAYNQQSPLQDTFGQVGGITAQARLPANPLELTQAANAANAANAAPAAPAAPAAVAAADATVAESAGLVSAAGATPNALYNPNKPLMLGLGMGSQATNAAVPQGTGQAPVQMAAADSAATTAAAVAQDLSKTMELLSSSIAASKKSASEAMANGPTSVRTKAATRPRNLNMMAKDDDDSYNNFNVNSVQRLEEDAATTASPCSDSFAHPDAFTRDIDDFATSQGLLPLGAQSQAFAQSPSAGDAMATPEQSMSMDEPFTQGPSNRDAQDCYEPAPAPSAAP